MTALLDPWLWSVVVSWYALAAVVAAGVVRTANVTDDELGGVLFLWYVSPALGVLATGVILTALTAAFLAVAMVVAAVLPVACVVIGYDLCRRAVRLVRPKYVTLTPAPE